MADRLLVAGQRALRRGAVAGLRRRERALRRRGRAPSSRRTRRSGCTTTTSGSCRACCAAACRQPASASFTTRRFPPPTSSRSCPGARRSWRACWTAISSASTCRTSPTTSPRRRRTSSARRSRGERPSATAFSRAGTALSAPTMARELEFGSRRIGLGAFPVGVDSERIDAVRATPAHARRVAAIGQELAGQQIILSVERLDYVKGPVERLLAYERLLDEHAAVPRSGRIRQRRRAGGRDDGGPSRAARRGRHARRPHQRAPRDASRGRRCGTSTSRCPSRRS